MVYIIFSIICSSCLFLLFKLFEQKKINTFQAIVCNYIVASVFGFLRVDKIHATIYQENWFIHAIIIGILFISMFYIIAFTSQKIGPSVASVANKMSVVIPVIFAIILYNDSITIFKIVGLLIALIGVYFATKRDSNNIQIGKWLGIGLVAFLFFGNGFLDSYLNYTEKYFLSDNDTHLFTPVIFSSAFILGIFVLAYQLLFLKYKLCKKSLLWGVLLGVFNYGSIFFLIKSLQLPNMESSIVFPINNVGIVVTTSIFSFYIFKEKLSVKNVIGISLSAISILIISFSDF